MKDCEIVYAFVDNQNLVMGVKRLGWTLDFKRFYVYLREKYHVTKVYIFLGFIFSNSHLYKYLRSVGYTLVFRKVTYDKKNKIKGNVDVDLTVQVLIDIDKYDKAILVTSDGDFYPLVLELQRRGKLLTIMSPHSKTCSRLIKISAKEKILYLDKLENKLKKMETPY